MFWIWASHLKTELPWGTRDKRENANIAWILAPAQDLLESYFKLAPKVHSMVKHGGLCSKIISMARNGVVSKVFLNEALEQLTRVQPSLLEKVGGLGLDFQPSCENLAPYCLSKAPTKVMTNYFITCSPSMPKNSCHPRFQWKVQLSHDKFFQNVPLNSCDPRWKIQPSYSLKSIEEYAQCWDGIGSMPKARKRSRC